MVENQPLIGAILKMERMNQSRSQKDICFGICVPSYLSKIEYGTVKPDEEILEKLFSKLGITYLKRGEHFHHLQMKVADFYERMQYSLSTDEIYRDLYREDKELSFSELAIDWLMIKAINNQNTERMLSELEANMTPMQLAYYRILGFATFDDIDKKLSVMEEAANTINSSFTLGMLCQEYLMQSKYAKIHQLENRITALALSEGNTHQLAEFYFMNGTAYACVNMEEMMVVNYERTMHLLQNTGWENELSDIHYNMGATYISLKKYDLALKYLFMANEEQGCKSFSTNQKIALTLIRKGECEKAKDYLKILKKMILSDCNTESLETLMYEEVEWELKDNFLSNPEYLSLLEKLIKRVKKERHFGHVYFYRDVVTAAYINQRKYKKALEFQDDISPIR